MWKNQKFSTGSTRQFFQTHESGWSQFKVFFRLLKDEQINLGNVNSDSEVDFESDANFDIIVNTDKVDDLTPIVDINSFKQTLCEWTYGKPCEPNL